LPERNSTSSRSRNLVFFLLFLLIVLTFLCVSLVYIILFHFHSEIFPKIVILTGIAFIGLISVIVISAYINRRIVSESKFPICHDLLHEFKLCARCKAFYIGLTLFGIMIAVRNTLFMDLLNTIGAYPYVVITFVILVSVPIHGALRRLEIISSDKWLHLVGFVFSSCLYLFGNFLVFALYGSQSI